MSYLSTDNIGQKLSNKARLFWRRTNSDPTINDHAPTIGCTWINTTTGEVFVYQGQNSSGYAKWTGQRNTLVGNPIVMDVFNDSSCIAFWRFEDNANDDGGNYNGTWVGTPQYDTGVIGKAAKFDGSSYIRYDNVGNLINVHTSPKTISLWIKPTNSNVVILYKGSYPYSTYVHGEMGLSLSSNNNIITGYEDSSDNDLNIISTSTILLGEWYYICITLNETSTKLYVNGVLDSNITPLYQYYNTSTPFIIGTEGTKFYVGLIDNVRIFNRALTDTEVQYLYNLEKP